MNKHYILQLQFHGYWHCGSGRSEAFTLDAKPVLNQYGLPYVPGKTLKGLLRDAMQRAEDWQLVKEGSVREIFGGNVAENQEGYLRVGDAQLSDNDTMSFKREPELIPLLFTDFFSTAINSQTGSAKNKSLRNRQVVMPVNLHAPLSIYSIDSKRMAIILEKINRVLPLIRSIGHQRSRGLGRVTIQTVAAEKEFYA